MKVVKIEYVRKNDVVKLLNRSDVLTIEMDGKPVHDIAHLAVDRVNRKPVYRATGYNRSTRKYSLQKWDDISAGTEKKKGTFVLIDFDY
jgi:hypothetical protein